MSSLWRAVAVSLIIHGIALFFPQHSPPPRHPTKRLEATLAPRPAMPLATTPAPPVAELPSSRRQAGRQLLAIEKARESPSDPAIPKWSSAEREEMNQFLSELDNHAGAGPDLSQRARAMARTFSRQQVRENDEEIQLLERIPNSPPLDPFSIEMYLDGLVKKLNRSAAFVRNDPRSRGMKTAAVLIHLNPNGSLRSFKVLNAADQQDEIAFIRSVVERAVPFPAFPPDIQKSAQSLGMLICILPSSLSGGGFGFTRTGDGNRC